MSIRTLLATGRSGVGKSEMRRRLADNISGIAARVIVLCVFLLPFVLMALNAYGVLDVTPLGNLRQAENVSPFEVPIYSAAWIPVIWVAPFMVAFVLGGWKRA